MCSTPYNRFAWPRTTDHIAASELSMTRHHEFLEVLAMIFALAIGQANVLSVGFILLVLRNQC